MSHTHLSGPTLSPAAAQEAARRALAEQDEERVLPAILDAAATAQSDPRLWQWVALLLRALDRREEALEAFSRAAALAPRDVSIAHGRAHVALEAGIPSLSLFMMALNLAPDRFDIMLGLAAARLAAGEGARGISDLAEQLDRNPGWIAGHEQFAQMSWMLGDRTEFIAKFERSLSRVPQNEALWNAYVATLLHAKNQAAADVVARARAAFSGSRVFAGHNAVIRSETGDDQGADLIFNALAPIDEPILATQHVRHLLRSRRFEAALPIIERWIADPMGAAMWPYASIVWRISGDDRYRWLDEQPGLVRIYDLTDQLPPLERLADVLRGLHRANGEHLDQSVRGGTQSDGPLFANINPDIRAVRATVVATIADYIKRLPLRDMRHPTLAPRRDRVPRFAGSWSVRLTGQGHHANHVHPAGWISSALYIALPDTGIDRMSHDGWLTLGEPDARLGLDLPPTRLVQPRSGQLVLFPSTMWHGTRPFAQGERLTIAFDVAHPAP